MTQTSGVVIPLPRRAPDSTSELELYLDNSRAVADPQLRESRALGAAVLAVALSGLFWVPATLVALRLFA